MKTLLFAAAVALLGCADAVAQSKTTTGPAASDKRLLAVVTTNRADAQLVNRTNRLTDKMVRQLSLNNYQANKLRAINREKVARMMEIERREAANPSKVDADCQGVCQERDRELRNLLSTAQYNDYYDARTDFYRYDKQFLAQSRGETRQGDTGSDYNIPGMAAPIDVKDAPAPQTLQSKPKGRKE